MYKNLFKFVVTTITILTANLITSYISDNLISFKSRFRPLTFTLIAMGIITVVFYPLFMKLEEWLNHISSHFVKSSKKIGGKYLGLLLIFIISLIILLYFYAEMWYNINLFKAILNGRVLKMF